MAKTVSLEQLPDGTIIVVNGKVVYFREWCECDGGKVWPVITIKRIGGETSWPFRAIIGNPGHLVDGVDSSGEDLSRMLEGYLHRSIANPIAMIFRMTKATPKSIYAAGFRKHQIIVTDCPNVC